MKKILLKNSETGFQKAGVNKLPFPPVFAGEKLLKNSSQGRITMDLDLVLLTCTIKAIRSNCFLPDKSVTEKKFRLWQGHFQIYLFTLNKYHVEIFFTYAKLVQNLSFRATYNNFLVIKLGKNYLIIGIRQRKHFKITGRIHTPVKKLKLIFKMLKLVFKRPKLPCPAFSLRGMGWIPHKKKPESYACSILVCQDLS